MRLPTTNSLRLTHRERSSYVLERVTDAEGTVVADDDQHLDRPAWNITETCQHVG